MFDSVEISLFLAPADAASDASATDAGSDASSF